MRPRRYSEYQPVSLLPEEKATLLRLSEEKKQPIAEIMREYMHRGWEEDGVQLEKLE